VTNQITTEMREQVKQELQKEGWRSAKDVAAAYVAGMNQCARALESYAAGHKTLVELAREMGMDAGDVVRAMRQFHSGDEG
jgi:hypothetical protein